MTDGVILPGRLRSLAATSAVAALIVEQHVIRVSGASSDQTVSKWNTGSYVFGAFVATYGRLDSSTFEAFYECLENSGMAAVTKKNYWKFARTHANDLMSRGRVPRFRVPHRYTNARIKAATPPPPNLSDGLAPGVVGISDGDLLTKVIGWSYGQLDRWDRLRAIGQEIVSASAGSFRAAEGQAEIGFRRISMPQDWIAAFVESRQDEFVDLGVPTEPNSLSALAFCLSYAAKRFDGVPLTVTQAEASGDETTLGKVYRNRIGRIGMTAPGLCTTMMVPGYEQAAALAILLAASMVNPTSILTMGHDCLQSSQQAGVSILTWTKPRAGGELPGIGLTNPDEADDDEDGPDVTRDADGLRSRAFRNRGGQAPTWSIINAVERYRLAATPLYRRMLPSNAFSSRLLLAQPTKAHLDKDPEVISVESLCRSVKAAAARCAVDLAHSDPRLAGLTFTLRAVRTSATQDHNRRSGSVEKTKNVAQHRNAGTTAGYLEHPELRAASTARTRAIQDLIVAATRTGTLVVASEQAPADIEQIGHGIGCRDRMAGIALNERAGRACEAFLCCLACPNGIVLATPLSFGLLSRLRDHLSAPGERRLREPERYDLWVRPAIELATRAMAEFPPAIAVEGASLSARLNIDFGGVW